MCCAKALQLAWHPQEWRLYAGGGYGGSDGYQGEGRMQGE